MSLTESSTRIPARSRRQAMDWSLALVSQGIEATIDFSPETGWNLIVASSDGARALEVIRQYRLENRRWPWPKDVFRAGTVFDWSSLAWVFLISLFFWLEDTYPGLRHAGAMNGAAVAHGQWWRLFTAIFLHADASHLLANAGIGFVLLGLAMGAYGTGAGLLAAYLAGAGGNLITMPFYFSESHHSLGASGMVMGCIGLLAVQSISLWRRNPRASKVLAGGMAAGLMLFVLMGLSPGTDVIAHFGGFVCGILLGGILMLIPRLLHRLAANVWASALFAVLVILPWWRALSEGR